MNKRKNRTASAVSETAEAPTATSLPTHVVLILCYSMVQMETCDDTTLWGAVQARTLWHPQSA